MKISQMILISLLLLQFLAAPVLGTSCESCHSPSQNPSGGWVYHPPIISLIHDPFYPPCTNFTVKLVVSGASDYSISSLKAGLEMEEGSGIHLTGEANGTLRESVEGVPIIEWELRSDEEGVFNITANADYRVHFEHKVPGDNDDADYSTTITSSIRVADLGLHVSPGTLIFSREGEERVLTLEAIRNVHDISIVPDRSIVDSLSILQDGTSLLEGESMEIMLSLTNRSTGIYRINLSWTENGTRDSVSIEVVIKEGGEEGRGIDLLWEVGRYSGIAAFALLLIGYFTGGMSPLKSLANRVFGSAKRRVDFHCALSYNTLILALIHFTALFYGPFRDVLLHWEVILGELALLIMVIISINGIFQRRFVKLWGFQNWRRVHSWGSYLITSLIVIHMLMYGSHFGWLRGLIS